MESNMKNRVFTVILIGFVLLSAIPVFGQYSEVERDRRGQTGMKFLSVSLDARSAAMADAVTSQIASSSAMFYNPASLGWFEGTLDASLGQTQWIADVTYNAAGIAYNTPIGVFGLSGVMVDYGEVTETIRTDETTDDGTQGYEIIGSLNPSALAIGVTYARALTNRFSIGGNVKLARQSLGDVAVARDVGNLEEKNYALSTAVFDFGILYRTGFKSLNLAMSARNFSQELTYAEESFELPLNFRIGVSMDVMDLTAMDPGMHSLVLSVDTERPRDFSEQVKLGAEYLLMNKFAVRAGYIAPTDEQGLSFGFGLNNIAGLDIDYAYSQFGIFGNVNRFMIKYGF